MHITDRVRNIRIEIRGKVQGVGFRPFIFRQAKKYNLNGYVVNTTAGVLIEIAGNDNLIDNFLKSIQKDKPKLAEINNFKVTDIKSSVFSSFNIRNSIRTNTGPASILPDIASCPECVSEIFDPENRRYHYPFTNCTNCGPRYSIIESLPYDRENTTMNIFEMCSQCREEYENPNDRRFHAQPIACPVCGPHLILLDKYSNTINSQYDAIEKSVEILRSGKILAIKGLGGFQFLVNAKDDQAINNLRTRKKRERKPLALMIPDIAMLDELCTPSDEEIALLQTVESPIVLINKNVNNNIIAPNVAPNNYSLGVMLPYTPLHHLLMHEFNDPIVCTSGNFSEEPIIINNEDAIQRLKPIADYFLVHNRPIARPVDDSVAIIISGRPSIIRNARGYAPTEIDIEYSDRNILAVGSHMKNTIALKSGNRCYISQHIGDLNSKLTYNTFTETINTMTALYGITPDSVMSDKHQEYLSTIYAHSLEKPVIPVQHHYAHLLSCMLENHLKPPVLGVVLDGTGLGDDNTIWGGEFLAAYDNHFERIGHLKQFQMPGGDKAALEPRRSALSILYSIFGNDAFTLRDCHSTNAFIKEELVIIHKMLQQNINSPLTSSMGRLFDAVSSLLGLCQISDYEAEAAMNLEWAAAGISTDYYYEYDIVKNNHTYIIDWRLIIENLLTDIKNQTDIKLIATKFHNTIAEIIISMVKLVKIEQVAMTGGCFQNKYLTERIIYRLNQEKYEPYWHHLIPANDGGISAGQLNAGVISNKRK